MTEAKERERERERQTRKNEKSNDKPKHSRRQRTLPSGQRCHFLRLCSAQPSKQDEQSPHCRIKIFETTNHYNQPNPTQPNRRQKFSSVYVAFLCSTLLPFWTLQSKLWGSTCAAYPTQISERSASNVFLLIRMRLSDECGNEAFQLLDPPPLSHHQFHELFVAE